MKLTNQANLFSDGIKVIWLHICKQNLGFCGQQSRESQHGPRPSVHNSLWKVTWSANLARTSWVSQPWGSTKTSFWEAQWPSLLHVFLNTHSLRKEQNKFITSLCIGINMFCFYLGPELAVLRGDHKWCQEPNQDEFHARHSPLYYFYSSILKSIF